MRSRTKITIILTSENVLPEYEYVMNFDLSENCTKIDVREINEGHPRNGTNELQFGGWL